jgi:AcrR family transcriptional regulator
VRRNALKAKQRGDRAVVVSPRVQVSEMQRARLLAAAAVCIAESGYEHCSVAHITARARVSRRTFYDLFDGREECLIALLQDTVDRLMVEIAAADLSGLVWRERVRGGLFVILSFLDREPVLARVCVVRALQGGPRVLAWREELSGWLTRILDRGRVDSSRARVCTSLTAEGLVGAVFAIVYARLSSRERGESLGSLLGELMGLIVLPYFGPDAARREQRGIGTFASGGGQSAGGVKGPAGLADLAVGDPLAEVPMRLTYRTARVLQAAAVNPGASNRHLGEQADIHDQGQISKLLGRLQRLGLLQNTGAGHAKGEPNAWSLTALGKSVTEQLALSTDPQHGEAS